MDGACNEIYVSGEIVSGPAFSHVCRGEAFSRLTLSVRRLSGTADVLPVLLPARATPPGAGPGSPFWARGQVRAYLRAPGESPRLFVAVFARAAGTDARPHENAAELCGYVCKPPVLRQTPMGRVLTDLFLACNRNFGRSDYLPVIAWGGNAHECAGLSVGDFVRVRGRLQSREYGKLLETGERAAYTVCELSGTVKRERPGAD